MNVNLRERWRIALLVVLVLSSGAALFLPAIGADSGPTNLQYGLELDGGARVTAPVDGVTADVNVSADDPVAFEDKVAAELGVESTDVRALPSENAVEAYNNVSTDELESALTALDRPPENVRTGVTATTRKAVARTVRNKINAAGLSGGNVQVADNKFIVIEVPNANGSDIRDLVRDRGVVRVVANYPVTENGSTTYRNTTAISQEQISDVRPAGMYGQPPQAAVPITLTQNGADSFASVMSENGFTDSDATTGSAGRGPNACAPGQNTVNDGYCILTIRDGEVVYSAAMSDDLAASIEDGTFQETRQFQITAGDNMSQARDLRVDLQAGALPAPLDLEAGTDYFLSSELAEDFKLYSLITGLIAVLAVFGAVYARYREPWVAAPMVLTALSEVVILLGFSAAIGLPLDLSYIAGFIAVIGTGVDDLIIIADEVMTQEVSSSRVFQSRFRKALWVIGAAAATTIIAMSPLAVLSLGALRGFAIITILGVLIGVIVTRPAYGDILRARLTDH